MELNLSDLELLHFFCTSTASSYHHNPIARRVMSINVPQLGFSHDFVMHGILALAALHLAKTSPERREICIEQAVLHYQTGLKKASLVLPAIDEDNCSALYIFSALTLLYTLASTTLHSTDNFILVGEAGIAEWIVLSRQSYSIVRVAGEALRAGPLGPIFSAGERRAALQDEHTVTSEGTECLQAIAAHIDETTPDPNHREAYNQTISELIKIYGVIESLIMQKLPPETSDIFIWPYKLNDPYLDLLQQPTQEALVILSFFAVLPLRFEHHWFLEDFSTHLISRIYPLIDEDHLSWIQWPLQEIGWKPETPEMYSIYQLPTHILSSIRPDMDH